jgi:MFS family permease
MEDRSWAESVLGGLLTVLEGKSFSLGIIVIWQANNVFHVRFNVLFVCGALTSAVTYCWSFMTSLGAMVAFSVLYGLFSGGLIPLGSACVVQTTPNMGYVGARIGAMMGICSIGALIGGPISGAIKDVAGSPWIGVDSFAASITLFGAIMLIGIRFVFEPRWNVIF